MGDADDFGRTFFMAGVGDDESAASTGEPLINATVAVTDATALAADSAAADTSPEPRPDDGGVMPLFELALLW